MPKHIPQLTSRIAMTTLLLTSLPILQVEATAPLHSQMSTQETTKIFPLSQLTVINDSAIRLGKTHFRITKSQSAFLSQNKEALKGARLSLRYNASRQVTEFVGVELNRYGLSNEQPIVFDGQQQSFAGTIRINARNISVKNVKAVNYLYLTANANATTQLINVHATKVSQAKLPQLTKQAVRLSKVIIQGGSFESVDLQRTNTRLQVRGSAVLNEVRSFANTQLYNTTSSQVTDIHTGRDVTSLLLSGTVKNMHNASRDLALTGSASLTQLTVTAKDAKLLLKTNGTIGQVNVPASNTTIVAEEQTTIEAMQLESSATITTGQSIKTLDVQGKDSTINLNASVNQLRVHQQATVQVAQNETIKRLLTTKPVTVEGTGAIDAIELEEGANDITLHVPVKTLTVKGKGQDPIRVSGTAVIDHVVLDGEAPLSIDVSKITHIEATSTNTGTVDTGETVVDKNDVTLPNPPVETPQPEPPVVIPPVTDPVGPPEDDATTNLQKWFEFYKTSIDSDFTVSADLTIGDFESEKDMFLHIPKGVTLTIDRPITGGHQIQFIGEGTVILKEYGLLDTQRVNFEEAIEFPEVFPEGVFASRAPGEDFPNHVRTYFEYNTLQEATSSGDIVLLQTDVTLDTPIRIRHGIEIKTTTRSTIRPSERFTDDEAHTYGYLIDIQSPDEAVVLSGLRLSNHTGGGIRVLRSNNVTLNSTHLIDNANEAISIENSKVTMNDVYTERNGESAIMIENWREGDQSTVTFTNPVLTEGVPVTTSTDPSRISLTLPEEFMQQEDEIKHQTQWVRKPGIYKLNRNTGTERFETITEATIAQDYDDHIIVNGAHTTQDTIKLSEEVYLRGEQNGTLQPSSNFRGEDLIHLVDGSHVAIIENLIVEGAPRYGIQIINKGDAVLKNVTSRNNGVGGVMSNSSHVTAYGLNTDGNGEFGVGVEVIENASLRSHFYYESGELNEPIAAISYGNAAGANAHFINHDYRFEEVKESNATKWIKLSVPEYE